MKYFLVEVEGYKYHSYDNSDNEEFKKNHLVLAETRKSAKEKVQKHYKNLSEPYGGEVYKVSVEVQDTIE